MSMAVKPGYVNPLTLMGKKHNGLNPNASGKQKADKSDDVEDLQTKQQSLRNQMLIMKSSSDGAANSSETQEVMEEELEQISAELKTAKAMEARTVSDTPTALANQKANFDHYEKSAQKEESAGMYQILKDKEDTYKVLFSPYEN